MTLVKRNPNTAPVMDSLLNDFFSDNFLNWPASPAQRSRNNSPAVNITENEDQWSIDLAVPGMKKEDFKVELDKNLLSISAEVKDEKAEEKDNYRLKEFSYSSFKRSFRIPENKVEGTKINAQYENGVLRISVPKKEEAKPQPARMIEIS